MNFSEVFPVSLVTIDQVIVGSSPATEKPDFLEKPIDQILRKKVMICRPFNLVTPNKLMRFASVAFFINVELGLLKRTSLLKRINQKLAKFFHLTKRIE